MRSTLALNGLGLYYNEPKSYLFANGTEIIKFKAKNLKGNISKDFSLDNMKKTGLNGYVYDFSIEEFNEKFSIIST